MRKKPHILLKNVSVDTFIVKGAKITQTTCHYIKRHLKQVFENVYRYELETKLSQKLRKIWTRDIVVPKTKEDMN